MSSLTVGEGQFMDDVEGAEEFLTLVVKDEEVVQTTPTIPTTIH
jgi:hypothetical protein